MAMYKYNSWTLPGLPANWNQVTHRYAVVLRSRESGAVECFQLLVSSLPFVVKVVNGTQVIAFPCESSVYNSFWFTENEQWWDLSEVELEHAENCQFHYVAASTNDSGLSYDWIWCNESIRDDANNVVYPGSVPILIEEPELEPEPEAYDKQRFLNGLAAALCSKARAFPKREPMFLLGRVSKEGETPTHIINDRGYVGVVVPDIETVYTPELQKTYPYAYVYDDVSGDGYCLSIFSEPCYWTYSEVMGYRLSGAGIDSVDYIYIPGVSEKWEDWRTSVPFGGEHMPLHWANVGISNPDGNGLFFAKSDPVPIYGPPKAFSYNGLVLPDICSVYTPKVQAQYPNAIIMAFPGYYDGERHGLFAYLYYAENPWAFVGKNQYGNDELAPVPLAPHQWYHTGLQDGFEYPWTYGGEYGNPSMSDWTELLWANHTVCNEDGTPYLYASDPIPVYE